MLEALIGPNEICQGSLGLNIFFVKKSTISTFLDSSVQLGSLEFKKAHSAAQKGSMKIVEANWGIYVKIGYWNIFGLKRVNWGSLKDRLIGSKKVKKTV